MNRETLHDWLCAEPFSLTLSSGFFAFFAHCGVVSALEERELRPARISGSSAGALVGGAWAAGVDSVTIRNTLLSLSRADFWDPGLGVGLLQGRLFRQQLDQLLPVRSVEDCEIPFSASVFDPLRRRTRVIEEGALADAIQASCSVPLLFQPVWLDGRPHFDGGISDRPGLAGMPAGRLLYHHIASRSPWRLPRDRALRIPDRAQMVTLTVDDLPRVGPFRLGRGAQAYERAYLGTKRAFDLPLAAVMRV